MKKSIKKLIAIGIIASSLSALPIVGASASWKQDSNGWWNTEGNSYSIGWKQIDGKWYHFNGNGYMEFNKTVDGYLLGSDGALIQNTPINNTNVNQNTATQKNSVNSKEGAVAYLNANCSTLKTPIGDLKFTFNVEENLSGVMKFDYWVQVDFGGISNSPYGINYFSPYILEYDSKISEKDKKATIKALKDYQQVIGEAFTTNLKDKKVMGGFYSGYYKYPALKVGYNSIKFFSWANYDEHGNSGVKDGIFRWNDSLDDYKF